MTNPADKKPSSGLSKIVVALIGAVGIIGAAVIGVIKTSPLGGSASPNTNNNNIVIDLNKSGLGTSVASQKNTTSEHLAQAANVLSEQANPADTSSNAEKNLRIDLSKVKHINVNSSASTTNYKLTVMTVDFAGDEMRVSFEAKGKDDMPDPFRACLMEQPSREATKAIKAPLTVSQPGDFKGYLSFKSDFLKKGLSYYLHYECYPASGAFLFSVSE